MFSTTHEIANFKIVVKNDILELYKGKGDIAKTKMEGWVKAKNIRYNTQEKGIAKNIKTYISKSKGYPYPAYSDRKKKTKIGKYYYTFKEENGTRLKSSWRKIGDYRYYFNKDGHLINKKGWHTIKGVGKNGTKYTDCWNKKDKVWINSKGKLCKKSSGHSAKKFN